MSAPASFTAVATLAPCGHFIHEEIECQINYSLELREEVPFPREMTSCILCFSERERHMPRVTQLESKSLDF